MQRVILWCLVILTLAVSYSQCKKQVCESLEIPTNVVAKYKNFGSDKKSKVGSKITFKCRKGFLRVGPRRTKCRPNGQWSHNLPICADAKIKCPEPQKIGNGTVTVKSRQVTKKITYKCIKGYRMIGKPHLVCLPSGNWSGNPPTCKIRTCRKPRRLDSFKHGAYKGEGKTYEYGSTITFFCNDGFHINNADAMSCNKYGRWEPRFIPKCLPFSCGDPGRPENGRRIGSDFTVGAKVEFRCNPGYSLIGSSIRTCQPNRLWDGELAVCSSKRYDCVDPGTPANGRRIGNNFNVGDRVTFECWTGFTLVGTETRRCRKDGNWTGSSVYCEDDNKVIIPSINETADLFASNFMNRLAPTKCKTDDKGKCIRLFSRGRSINIDHPNGLDLAFLLDSSTSIGKTNFKLALNFVCYLIQQFGVDYGPGGTRVAAVTFNTKAYLVYNFGDIEVDTAERACQKTSEIKYSGGGTATRAGLSLIKETVPFEKKRAKVLIMITDGQYNAGGSPIDLADELKDPKQHGVEIYTIGVGTSIKRGQLKKIATKEGGEHAFHLESYKSFDNLTEMLVARDYGICGESTVASRGRVMGGVNSRHGNQWPWQVALFRTNSQGTDYGLQCGGTIIRKDVVVTAAHCLGGFGQPIRREPHQYRIVVGTVKFNLSTDARQERLAWMDEVGFTVKKIYVHPSFKFGRAGFERGYSGDVAIFQLDKPVKWSRIVRPLCLPGPEDFLEEKQGGYVSGWGKTHGFDAGFSEQLRHVWLNVNSNEACKMDKFNETTMFCAGAGDGNQDACKGDSGGPFAVAEVGRSQPKYKLMGIVSWAPMRCGQEGFGYYTRVSNYLGWINRVIDETRRST